MGNTAAINTQNRDFNSVVPAGLVVAPSTNTTTHANNGKRKFGSSGTTIEIEQNDHLKNQQNLISRIPLTVKSDDRSDSYRSTDDATTDSTEGQLRREGMADCEFECSQISKFLYVGGIRVAENLELLKSKNITRIINCASSIIPNHFMNDSKYLSFNLVDGRGEDISWFVCEVIQFIFEGENEGQKTLLHCEKGISRSCSFAIAYRMWSTGEKWKKAFEYVQTRRKICNPHSVFVCNLIEIGEIFGGGAAEATLLFRCSYHGAYDQTAVLKVCRNLNSRRLLVPATSLLNPKGVYILRAVRGNMHFMFVWCGRLTSENTIDQAIYLANLMSRVFTQASSLVRINEGQETEEFLSFLMKDGGFKLPDDSSASYDDFYDFPPSEEQIEAAQFTIANQRENEYVANVLSNIGLRPNSTVRDTSPNEVAQRNTSVPPVSHANRLNSNNGEMTPRSRSTSRERPSLRNPKPIVGTIVTAGSGVANIAGRAMEPEPVSINLPPTLSRKNSFRNEDGSVNRQEFLDRINTIITSADVGSASTSKRFSSPVPVEEIRPIAATSSNQTYQQQPPQSAVPMKSQNVPSLKENAISAPIPASAATTANNFTNTLSGNGYSNNTPAMQYLPPGNTFPSNSYPVMSNPAPYNQPTNYQYQPHPPSSNKPPQMSLSSMSNFPTNTTTPNVYQNSNMNQPSGSSYNPHGNNVAPLSMSQVTNNQYNTTAAHGLYNPSNPNNVAPTNNPNTKKKVEPMKLSLPPISARSGNESARDDRPSPTGPPQGKPHVSSSNTVSNMNLYMNNVNNVPGGYHSNADEFNLYSPPTPTEGLSRNPSKTKIMAASAEINFTPIRPTSAERKSFGVSPRVAPYINTDKAHIGATSPMKLSNTNAGNLSARPVVPLNLAANVNGGGGNTAMNSYPPNNGQAIFQPTPPSTRRPDSDRSMHHPVDPTVYYQQVGVPMNQPVYAQNYGGGYQNTYQQPYVVSQGMNTVPNQTGVALPNVMMPNIRQNNVPLLNLTNVTSSQNPSSENQPKAKPLLFQLHKKGSPDSSNHGVSNQGEQYEWRAMGIYDDGDLEENLMLFLLCPDNAHHLWIGNEFDFNECGIEVDDQNRPIMSRLFKWLAKVGNGEIKNKSIVGNAFLSMDLSIHLSGEETDGFWDSFNDGF